MKYAALVLTAAVAIHPASAQAAVDDPRMLAPVSPWTLDFADERCSLIREFGDNDGKVRLQIDSYGPSPGYRVMLSGDLVAGSDAAPISEFRVGYSPDTREREWMGMVVGKLGDESAVSFGPGFLPDALPKDAAPIGPQQTSGPPQKADRPGSEFEQGVTHMTVAFRQRTPFRLDTGSMAAPFAAMHRCVDNLIASWGIDPAEHRTRSRPPLLVELPEGYTTIQVDLANDRPGYTERRHQAMARAVLRERAGPVPHAGYAVPVRVMIDATGQPTACVVQVASASEAYRRSVCDTFAGPYQPALDAQGRPVASFVQLGI